MERPKPSQQLVLQRVRNRMIETLELMASFEEQRSLNTLEYAPYEVLARWGDSAQALRTVDLAPPVFASDEVSAIQSVSAAVDHAADELPDDFPALVEVQGQAYWQSLRDFAAGALAVFRVRGELSEDIELSDPQ
jgi:hypothetical protein